MAVEPAALAALPPALPQDDYSNFQIAHVFSDNKAAVNALDFANAGDTLVSSSNDDSINVYDCLAPKHLGTVHVRQYGCGHVHFLPASRDQVLHSSSKENHAVRLLSMSAQKYTRYFHGHTNKVTSISTAEPINFFLTSAVDQTVRFWDAAAPNCVGVLRAGGRCVGSFDPQGQIFAVGMIDASGPAVKLYDPRSFWNGPFQTFAVPIAAPTEITGVKFSADGLFLALTTSSGSVHYIDSFKGAPACNLLHFGEDADVSLSPCGRFMAAGTADGPLRIASIKDGASRDLPGHRDSSVVAFNPRHALIASACQHVALWLAKDI